MRDHTHLKFLAVKTSRHTSIFKIYIIDFHWHSTLGGPPGLGTLWVYKRVCVAQEVRSPEF